MIFYVIHFKEINTFQTFCICIHGSFTLIIDWIDCISCSQHLGEFSACHSFDLSPRRSEVRSSVHHGIRQRGQWGGEESEGMWDIRAETQHPAAAEGLHRAAVHLTARQTHGLPQRTLREAGEGLYIRIILTESPCWQHFTLRKMGCAY